MKTFELEWNKIISQYKKCNMVLQSYEKPVKDTDIQIKKVLSSTPDKHIIKRKHVLSDKENIPSDGKYKR